MYQNEDPRLDGLYILLDMSLHGLVMELDDHGNVDKMPAFGGVDAGLEELEFDDHILHVCVDKVRDIIGKGDLDRDK